MSQQIGVALGPNVATTTISSTIYPNPHKTTRSIPPPDIATPPPPPPVAGRHAPQSSLSLHELGLGVLQEALMSTAVRPLSPPRPAKFVPNDTQSPPTPNRQPPPTANRNQPPTTNRRQPPPTSRGDQPPSANHYQPPPTNNRQPPIPANNHQPPRTASCQLPTANRHQPPNAPPIMVKHMECPRAFLGKLCNGKFFFPVKGRPGRCFWWAWGLASGPNDSNWGPRWGVD